MPRLLPALLLAAGCGSGSFTLEDLESAEDIEDVCDEFEPEEVTLEILFPAVTQACPWGEDDNDGMANGFLTARVEQTEGLEMPDDAVICDLKFDFSGLVPDEIQVMVYDDHFFFTFNDTVLAASYGPAVEILPEKEDMPRYDWESLRGMDYHAVDQPDPFCLGEDEGDAECEIPDTEVEGPISLSFDDDVVNKLSLGAIRDGRYDFGFVTTGDDNPDTDCHHEAFGFSVEVPFLTP